MHQFHPATPPPRLSSIKSWTIASAYTTAYGAAALPCVLSFAIIRRVRESLKDNNIHPKYLKLQQLERKCIDSAEYWRHRWGHSFCRAFGVNVEVEYKHISKQMIKERRYIFAQLNQQSILELAIA